MVLVKRILVPLAVLAIAVAPCLAQEPTDNVRLELRLQPNQNIDYRVQATEMGAPAATVVSYYCTMHPDQRSDTAGTCTICSMRLVPVPAGGIKRDNDDNGDGAGNAPGGLGASGMAKDKRFAFRVKETTSGGDSTLELRIRDEMGAGAPTAAGQPAAGEETWTLRIDRNGRLQELTCTSPKANEAGERPAGARDDAGMKHGAMKEEKEQKLRLGLAAIFGAGLHEQDLRKGEVYTVGAATGVARGQPGERPPGERERPTVHPGERPAGETARAEHSRAEPINLRFDGVSEVGTFRLARFTIQDKAAGTTPPAERPGGVPPGGELPGMGATGSASYHVDDGLLHELTCTHPAKREAAPGETLPSSKATITITRIHN